MPRRSLVCPLAHIRSEFWTLRSLAPGRSTSASSLWRRGKRSFGLASSGARGDRLYSGDVRMPREKTESRYPDWRLQSERYVYNIGTIQWLHLQADSPD